MSVFISICIPAYKRTAYLKRLLDSTQTQTFTDYEVVVTDDTPGNEVQLLCNTYKDFLPIKYFKNATALGTPENWNEGIRKASGVWIKIMHDDDWFESSQSLQVFAQRANNTRENSFIFSAYHFVSENSNQIKPVYLNKVNLVNLKKDVFYLYRTNYIGNPSCTLFKKREGVSFDKNFKWVVDFEFYIHYLTVSKTGITYINQPLINVGVNDSQVTNYTFRVAPVEIPENHQMLAKQGFFHLKRIYVYDYFWRLYRNLHITRIAQIREYGYDGEIPAALRSMIRYQKKLPQKWLHFGPFSKGVMLFHYLTHYRSIPGKQVSFTEN